MRTPTIRYFLENPKRKKANNRKSKELIMAEISYGYVGHDSKGKLRPKPFRISLQAKILPEKFGLKTENFKFNYGVFTKATKNNASIRTKMSKFQKAIDRLEDRYSLLDKVPIPSEFKSDLLIELDRRKRKDKKEHGILDYLHEKITKSKVESNRGKRDSLNANTIKTYKSVSHLIENYQIVKKEFLTFENFSKSKYWEFWDVMDDILKDKIKVDNPNQLKAQRKQPYGYLVTTIRKYQGALIRTLKDAFEDDEYMVDLALNVYDKNLVLKKHEAKKDIYITELELQKIIDADLEFDKSLQMAKEYIIIGSLTGMRYESMYDTKNTKLEHYTDENYDFDFIHSKQFKTSTEVYIPLFSLVKDIVKKYGDKFPVVQSNSTINANLKKMFKYLKIDSLENVTLKTYRSGIIELNKPKYQIISTHDCKKTFYTNLYNNKINPVAIDNITHPDATPKNRMAKIYNKSTMLDKAKMFVDELNKIDSNIYKF